MQVEQFVTLARYNSAMNRKIYSAAAQLSDRDRKQDRGAFFGSIHASLNHLVLVDRLWLSRIAGQTEDYEGLDQELYADFDELKVAHSKMGDRIETWADTLTTEQLQADIVYRDMSQVKSSCALWLIATHLFNHQTHHRGQITTLLSQLGIDVGVTDLPWVVEGMVKRSVS